MSMRRTVFLCWCAVFLTGLRCANTISILPAPSDGATVVAYAGLNFAMNFSAKLSAAISPPDAAYNLMGEQAAAVGMPRNSVLLCQAGYVGTTCPGSFSLSFTPSADEAGKSFSVCIRWRTVLQTPAPPATGCVNLQVLSPLPQVVKPSGDWHYGGRLQSNSKPRIYSFRGNVGCLMSVPVVVGDRLPNSAYSIILRPLVRSSSPPSPSGMPQAEGPEGTASLQFIAGNASSTQQTFEFRWRPIRGQESSRLYSVCFEAVDSLDMATSSQPSVALADRSVCFQIEVQKCQYCVQPGESLMSIATQLDTDWLHLYTANPTVLDPDNIVPYTRINTGVFYLSEKVSNALRSSAL